MMKPAKAMLGLGVMLLIGLVSAAAVDGLLSAPAEKHRHDSEDSQTVTYKRFEDEGRGLLGDCSKAKRRDLKDCLEYQQTFLEMYVDALTTGDYTPSLYQVGAFGALWTPAASVAVPKDAARSCAWAKMLSLTTGHDADRERDFHKLCDGLPSRVRDEAEGRFREIVDAWNLHAKPPPDGWKPKVAGLAD